MKQYGLTYQSVYKKLKNEKNDIYKFVKVRKGKVKIHKSAIDFYNGIEGDKEVEKVEFLVEKEVDKGDKVDISQSEDIERETETSQKIIIDLLNDRIQAQEQELNVKNKQIETLQEQLSNSQKLLAMEKQEKQALLESGNEEKLGIVGHIKRFMFGKKSDKVEE